ncbi:MAG: FecR family protein [Bacteroidota bacterium]
MIFNRLIDNPLFFKWIFHPSPEINAYWEHYLENNPEFRDQISELKGQIEAYLKFENKKLTETEKRSLAIRIAHELEQTDKRNIRSVVIRRMMRYAAIAFTFLFIGGSLVYLYMERRQPQIVVENAALPAQVQEPVLILGNRSPIKLNQGESQLDYSASGKIVFNSDKTINTDANDALPEMNTLVIPYGSRSTITLSDGTKVWLNAGSRLIYPSRFVDKIREVFLVGEAYFDVQENEKKPFLVKTTDVQVEVIGTKFNVTAYPEDYAVQTVLEEGSVEIKSAGAGKREKGLLLEPGHLAYFNKKTLETRKQKVNVDEYILWTNGLFSFTNTDFNRITKKLERYYNIQFQFDDPFKGGIQVSGKLDVTKEKTEVFKYLERLTGLQVLEINERLYVIK